MIYSTQYDDGNMHVRYTMNRLMTVQYRCVILSSAQNTIQYDWKGVILIENTCLCQNTCYVSKPMLRFNDNVPLVKSRGYYSISYAGDTVPLVKQGVL